MSQCLQGCPACGRLGPEAATEYSAYWVVMRNLGIDRSTGGKLGTFYTGDDDMISFWKSTLAVTWRTDDGKSPGRSGQTRNPYGEGSGIDREKDHSGLALGALSSRQTGDQSQWIYWWTGTGLRKEESCTLWAAGWHRWLRWTRQRKELVQGKRAPSCWGMWNLRYEWDIAWRRQLDND